MTAPRIARILHLLQSTGYHLEERRDRHDAPNSDVPESNVPESNAPESDAPESDAPFVEQLAELEHARWVREKLAEGWSYSPQRDDAARRHPSLVPWHASGDGIAGARYSAAERARMGPGPLSESERDKDRVRVNDIPAVLRRARLRLVRSADHDGHAGAMP